MKTLKGIVSSLSILACCGMAEVVDVYILSGQSNMSGFARALEANDAVDQDILYSYTTDGPPSIDVTTNGEFTTLTRQDTGNYGPEMTFARTIHAGSANKMAIIKLTDSGTTLEFDWNSRQVAGKQLWNMWKEDTAASLNNLIDLGYEPSVKGICWLQGESDSLTFGSNGGYEEAYLNLVNDMIDHVGNYADTSELKFTTALIQDRVEKNTYVREAQKNVMNLRSDWNYIDTDDLAVISDGVHLTAESLQEVGRRLAAFYGTAESKAQFFASLDGQQVTLSNQMNGKYLRQTEKRSKFNTSDVTKAEKMTLNVVEYGVDHVIVELTAENGNNLRLSGNKGWAIFINVSDDRTVMKIYYKELNLDDSNEAANLVVRDAGYEKMLGANLSEGNKVAKFSFSLNGLDNEECALRLAKYN